MASQKKVLPIIVIAQFCCTSLWFAGNAVMNELVADFNLPSTALGHLTSAVQFGFITGTLIFALLTIADRFPPSRVFFGAAFFGALFNVGTILSGNTLFSLLALRFATGFFLAGIYPVGMKIAADYFEKGLGKSLGFLVGALVIGTALPHLLKEFTKAFPWSYVLVFTSSLALIGGLLMFFLVPNGPFRKASQALDLSASFRVFRVPAFRSAAFGYFGHMWELYAFWAFVPVMLNTYSGTHAGVLFNVPILSFFIIGLGGLACFASGYLSAFRSTKGIAQLSLLLSGICCLLSPIFFIQSSAIIFIGFLIVWGMVVIADSPLFSTLVAQNADAEIKGTALTIVTCIGFAITIVSIQLLGFLIERMDPQYVYIFLVIGPILGLIALFQQK